MKVAIPTFGDRISPRFDCAASFLIVSIESGQLRDRQRLMVEGLNSHQRVQRLHALNVDCVVCGGIDNASAASLQFSGISLHARWTGPIDDVLSVIQEGKLDLAVGSTDDNSKTVLSITKEDIHVDGT